MIKEVKIKRNIIMVNKHHNRRYWSKEEIIVIERDDGKRFILNLKSDTDISDSDYIDIVDTRITKEKVLFKNIMLDTERLRRLAGN